MRRAHYITIAAAIGLIAILYWGGNTLPPATKKGETNQHVDAATMAPGPNTVKPASFDSILAAARIALKPLVADTVVAIEHELAAIPDSSRMAAVFIHLAHVWELHGHPTVAAFYGAKSAKLEKSEKKLTFAGQFFLECLEKDSSEPVQMFDAQQAIECFEYALELNPDYDSAKISLAQVYVATGQAMKGVGLLREITQKKPEDVPANMMLGRMSIQSKQYEKAIVRFETVLRKEPTNAEAMYFLGVSYMESGNKEKGIALLETCKKITNKPEFSKDIDNYINSFK